MACRGSESSTMERLALHPFEDDTPLMYAATAGSEELVKFLLDGGGDVNEASPFGRTALMSAAYEGHENVVIILCNYNADIHHKDHEGKSAILYAAMNGHKKLVTLLQSKGLDVHEVDRNGTTALIYASISGSLDLVKYLCCQDLRIDAVDNIGRTAVIYAVRNGFEDIVEFLCRYGANLNIHDIHDRNALAYASLKNFPNVIKVLCKPVYGLDVNYQGKTGMTALHVGAVQGFMEVVKELLRGGASITLQDTNGHTPLKLAKLSKHKEVECILRNAKSGRSKINMNFCFKSYIDIEESNTKKTEKFFNRSVTCASYMKLVEQEQIIPDEVLYENCPSQFLAVPYPTEKDDEDNNETYEKVDLVIPADVAGEVDDLNDGMICEHLPFSDAASTKTKKPSQRAMNVLSAKAKSPPPLPSSVPPPLPLSSPPQRPGTPKLRLDLSSATSTDNDAEAIFSPVTSPERPRLSRQLPISRGRYGTGASKPVIKSRDPSPEDSRPLSCPNKVCSPSLNDVHLSFNPDDSPSHLPHNDHYGSHSPDRPRSSPPLRPDKDQFETLPQQHQRNLQRPALHNSPLSSSSVLQDRPLSFAECPPINDTPLSLHAQNISPMSAKELLQSHPLPTQTSLPQQSETSIPSNKTSQNQHGGINGTIHEKARWLPSTGSPTMVNIKTSSQESLGAMADYPNTNDDQCPEDGATSPLPPIPPREPYQEESSIVKPIYDAVKQALSEISKEQAGHCYRENSNVSTDVNDSPNVTVNVHYNSYHHVKCDTLNVERTRFMAADHSTIEVHEAAQGEEEDDDDDDENDDESGVDIEEDDNEDDESLMPEKRPRSTCRYDDDGAVANTDEETNDFVEEKPVEKMRGSGNCKTRRPCSKSISRPRQSLDASKVNDNDDDDDDVNERKCLLTENTRL